MSQKKLKIIKTLIRQLRNEYIGILIFQIHQQEINGFLLTFGYADQFTPYDEFSELDFKRGNLLNEEVYNENEKKS